MFLVLALPDMCVVFFDFLYAIYYLLLLSPYYLLIILVDLDHYNIRLGVARKKEKHDCGTPPPQGEYRSGLNPPILSTNNKVTGATTNMLHKENRNK